MEGPERPGGHLPISELPVSQPVVLGPVRDHLSRLREGKAVPLSSAQSWILLLALGKKSAPTSRTPKSGCPGTELGWTKEDGPAARPQFISIP